MVKWLKPLANSIMLNSDNASKGNPGSFGGDCILKDHIGNMVYALLNFYGLCSKIPMEHTDQNQISDIVIKESFLKKAEGATLAIELSNIQDVFTLSL